MNFQLQGSLLVMHINMGVLTNISLCTTRTHKPNSKGFVVAVVTISTNCSYIVELGTTHTFQQDSFILTYYWLCKKIFASSLRL